MEYKVVEYCEDLGVNQMKKSAFKSGGEWAADNMQSFINRYASDGWEFVKCERVAFPNPDVPNAPAREFQLLVFKR